MFADTRCDERTQCRFLLHARSISRLFSSEKSPQSELERETLSSNLSFAAVDIEFDTGDERRIR
jgi:hypothetical protein